MKALLICSFKPLLRWNWLIKSVRVFSHPIKILVYLSCGLGALSSQATVLFPEFKSVLSSQADTVSVPTQINSEYSSDYLTYSKPFSWEKKFWSQANAFDLSTGSLSGEEFQVQDRLKLHQWLIEDKLQFRFTYFSQQDYETNQNHKILELVYKLHPLFAVSASGDVSFFKAEDDVSLAFLFQPNDKSEHRLFYSWIDYDRNKRNKEPDRFEQAPTKYGVVGRHFTGPWFFKYAFTYSPELIWNFPTNLRQYESQNYLASVHTQYEWDDETYLGIEILTDELFESESPLPTGTLTSKTIRRKRWMQRTEFTHLIDSYKLRWGLATYYREYKVNSDKLMFRDVLPYVGFILKPRPSENFTWDNELGLETTYHRGTQTAIIFADTPNDHRYEYRFNWRTTFDFKDQGELALIFTADLDEFGTGRTWEGGNAQFRFWF